MAATRLIAVHINKGKTAAQSLADRLDYSHNPIKTNDGEFVTGYECDPRTAWEEFLLTKREYEQKTGRQQKGDVLAYQIRQSFKPGEITPEEANRLGRELAMRFTKGKHAFTVSTHTDKAHIHNHIYFNSTTLDGTKKFKNYGKPRSKDFHWKHFKNLLKDNDLPDIRWHDLRATYCTILLKNDFNPKAVSKLMGHAKEIITIDVYGDNREIIEDCLENLEPFIDEVLPEEEVIDLCDVDCMDFAASELIE